MYELQVEHRFHARHGVRLPSGGIEPLHDHEWRIKVFVVAEKLDENGMVIDFHVLLNLLKKAAHSLAPTSSVNETPFFAGRGASTEQMAYFFYEWLTERLPRHVRLKAVRLWEEPDRAATYYPSGRDDRA